jgi:hypothetical protein
MERFGEIREICERFVSWELGAVKKISGKPCGI